MDYIYAVLLLHNAKKEITDANVKAVLAAAGVSVDDGKLKGLLASLKEVNIAEAIEKASMPVAAAAGPVAEVKEEKKEEEVEVSEESAAEGLGSLFG